ncbi:MAG: hypothetical protein LBC41_01520 [Clostridiales bacterium]|jgi:hypothetical protein|nr:hypothetical protein [Clostridiales bacterium]
MSKGYQLAMYDFSRKQDYIYRTNKIKEIVGASSIIKDAYKDFLDMLERKNYTIGFRIDESSPSKSCNEFKMAEFKSTCAVVYEGGGNLFLIFKDEESCLKANKLFSKMILEKAYGLSVVCAFVPVTDDFHKDLENVYKKSQMTKSTLPMIHPVNVLPYTLIDRSTSFPISAKLIMGKEKAEVSYSRESFLKREKHEGLVKSATPYAEVEKQLDNLITEKNEESLLAIIYIDGNAMGDKVKSLFDGDADSSYDHCVAKQREFSSKIDDAFIVQPLLAIEAEVEKMRKEMDNAEQGEEKADGSSRPPNEPLWYRRIIGGGDEITIICNARYALRLVKLYFKTVQIYNRDHDAQFSSCAGIAVFHSHNPFSTIYEIAEECCESAKKRNRLLFNSQNFYLDFHFCAAGVVNSLKAIRESQEEGFTNRPYCFQLPRKKSVASEGEEDRQGIFDQEHDLNRLEGVGKMLYRMGAENARSDVKALSDSIFAGESSFAMILARLESKYHSMDLKFLKAEYKKEIFDATIVHDLGWFNPGNSDKSEADKGSETLEGGDGGGNN